MTRGIRVPGSLENRKNPKARTTLHNTRCDQDVLVVVEINLVLPRNSLGIGQGKVRHLSVDSYVYRSRVESHTTQSQHSLIKLRPALSEMPKARPGDFTFEHHSLACWIRSRFLLQPHVVRVILSLHTLITAARIGTTYRAL